MEKKEMSFIEKAKAAAGEISKDINDNRASIVLAIDDEINKLYINMVGGDNMFIELLVLAAMENDVFGEILTSSLELIKEYKNK